jgi:gliding motility-associated-like protein
VKPELNFVYTATALDTIGCTHTGYVKVSIASNAILSIPDSVVLYPGDSYQLSPEGNCLYFTWFPATGLSADSIANPVAMPEVSTRYIVHGTTEYGCKVTDSIDVFIDPSTMLYLPNAFVPGNGTNGVFKIEKRGMATLNYFRIYDRWGVKVYDSKDIDAGWNGTYKGKPQPLGVYVYQIEAVTNTGQKFTKQGNVTLLR